MYVLEYFFNEMISVQLIQDYFLYYKYIIISLYQSCPSFNVKGLLHILQKHNKSCLCILQIFANKSTLL